MLRFYITDVAILYKIVSKAFVKYWYLMLMLKTKAYPVIIECRDNNVQTNFSFARYSLFVQ